MAYRDTVLSDLPKNYWRLGEAAGLIATDETGNNDGTYKNSPILGQPSLLPGESDPSINIPGTNAYVECPSISAEQLTLELWIKLHSAQVSGSALIDEWNFPEAKRKIKFAARQDNTISISFSSDGNSSIFSLVTDPVLIVGATHHVALTWDGLTTKVYVDGYEVAEGIATAPFTLAPVSSPMWIGYNRNGSGYESNALFDEVAVYDYDLSPDRILHHYLEGSNAPIMSGNATKSSGGPIDSVVIRNWQTKAHQAIAVPDLNGDWSARVPIGEYDVTYLADGCAPLCHGPYAMT